MKDIGNYTIQNEIGSGAFGKVYLGTHKLLNTQVCLKRGDKQATYQQDGSGNDNLMREFYYLREFRNHPQITKLYEVIFTENSVYMILEYYPNGDLFEYVTSQHHLCFDTALKIFTQLVGAVYYLHKSGCCHRDLKLENVLLDKHHNAKLSDFGFTRELPFITHGSKSLLNEFCGTGAYMAPELIQRNPYSGIKIDIWALGVILYTMLTGEMPFDDSLDSQELREAIVNSTPRYLDDNKNLECENNINDDVKILLRKLLEKDIDKRFSSLEDVLKNPILEKFGGLKELDHVNKLHYGSEFPRGEVSRAEKNLFNDLVKLGIDKDSLKIAIREQTLDSVYATWELLKDKQLKKKKMNKKKKGRAIIRLSTSKSLLTGVVGGDVDDGQISDGTKSIRRSNSLTSVKKLLSDGFKDREISSNLANVTEINELENHSSIISSKAPPTPDSIFLQKKGLRKKFSISSLFKSKTANKETLPISKSEFDGTESFLSRILTNGTTNTNVSFLSRKSKGSAEKISKDFSIENEISHDYSTPFDLKGKTLMDPSSSTDAKLKRSKPTRPGSVVSTYSIQTNLSETSNGSGYVTTFSNDTNIINAQNTGNDNNSNYSGLYNVALSTPQSTNYPKLTRGISEWSTNLSSQAESPNSSFTALSRSNSIDSVPRTRRLGRVKKPKVNIGLAMAANSSSGVIRRGKSPLSSKMNTTWKIDPVTFGKGKKKIRGAPESKIIEEEESYQDGSDQENQPNIANETQAPPVITPRFNKRHFTKGLSIPTLAVQHEEDENEIQNEEEADIEDLASFDADLDSMGDIIDRVMSQESSNTLSRLANKYGGDHIKPLIFDDAKESFNSQPITSNGGL